MSEMQEEFTTRSGSNNEAKLRRMLDDLRDSTIDHQNYEKLLGEVLKQVDTIDSQIENIYANYLPQKDEYDGFLKKDTTKNAFDNGVVPQEGFKMLRELSWKIREIASWKFLQVEALRILITKLEKALADAKAYEIKRDALKEMREMEQKRNELFLEVMTERNSAYQQGMRLTQEKYINDMKENTKTLCSALIDVSKLQQEFVKEVLKKSDNKDINPEEFVFSPKSYQDDRLIKENYNQILEVAKEREKKTQEKKVVEEKKIVDDKLDVEGLMREEL